MSDPCSSVAKFTYYEHEHYSHFTSSLPITPVSRSPNLERSLAFWRDVLGFELSHRPHQTGDLASEITGVPGAEISIAVLKGYGHKIELLEYLAPPDRKHVDLRPCDVGSVHVALLVDDLDAVLNTIAASGWKAAGKPQTLKSGPNAGKRVVYVRDPDGTTIEFMQIAAKA